MASPFRILVRPSRLAIACPNAAFSPGRLARPSLRAQAPSVSIKQTFLRAKHDGLPTTKAPNATDSKTAASLSNTPTMSTAGSPAPTIDWNTFFKLRLRRRRIQLVFSVTTGIFGVFVGAGAVSTGLAEPLVSQVPLDPFVTLGIVTFACGALGWLMGPSFGSQIFYATSKGLAGPIKRKESEFLTRVKRNRADPMNSSTGNPVPDFYGEKIQSVAGYRRWLKDQRAFNRKKTQAFI